MKIPPVPFVCFLLLSTPAVWGQTWGTPALLSEEGIVADSQETCRLTDDTFVVAYADHNDSSGKVGAYRLVRGSIETLDAISFDEDGKTSRAAPYAMARLADDRFILLYQDESPVGRALVGELSSDGKLSWVGESVVYSLPSKATHPEVAVLDRDRVLIAFFGESDRKGRVLLVQIKDDMIELGNPTIVNRSVGNEFNSIAVLSPNEFVLGYSLGATGGGHAILRHGEIRGDRVTLGPEFVLNPGNSPYVSCLPAGRDVCLVGYMANSMIHMALVSVRDGSFRVLRKGSIPEGGHLFDMDSLDGERFIFTFRHDASNRDTPVYIGQVGSDAIEMTRIGTLNKQASIQKVTTMHSRVALITHAIQGHRIEGTALAVPAR